MIIVTGGAGFLGSALLWQLNLQGIEDILVVDNLSTTEKWRNLAKRRFHDYMHRDRFRKLLRRGLRSIKASAIVHLGACSSTTERDCDFLMENNVHYTEDVCRAGIHANMRVIIASSAATYGNGAHGFRSDLDLMPAFRPLNMYGYSKHLTDLWLVRQGLTDRVASLKFFNVYGPNEYHKGSMRSVVAKAYEDVETSGRIKLFASTVDGVADGQQQRDFVYVKDCAAIMAWLLVEPEICGILNVGTGVARSFKDLASAVCASLGRPCNIEYVPMPEHLVPNYQSYTCADMTWLRELGCPVQCCSLEDGVADYVQNYLHTADPYL